MCVGLGDWELTLTIGQSLSLSLPAGTNLRLCPLLLAPVSTASKEMCAWEYPPRFALWGLPPHLTFPQLAFRAEMQADPLLEKMEEAGRGRKVDSHKCLVWFCFPLLGKSQNKFFKIKSLALSRQGVLCILCALFGRWDGSLSATPPGGLRELLQET